MGKVTTFEARQKSRPPPVRPETTQRGEIIIFPGVRIERHDLDLGHRLRDSAGQDEFAELGGDHWPRQTS